MGMNAQSGSMMAAASPSGAVQQMAQRAINALVSERSSHGPGHLVRLPTTSHTSVLPETTLNDLCDTLLTSGADSDAQYETILKLHRGGLSHPIIVDNVIPTLARRLGQRWFDDKISFADVTIGTERLQQTVRRLVAWDGTSAANFQMPASRDILLIVPYPEQHTLGSVVLTDQFRRLGYTVDLEVHPSPQRIAHVMQGGVYVMVGLTVAC